MRDVDNSEDSWLCPFCGYGGAVIIDDAVLKDDFKEIMCACDSCEELFIRKYKFVESIKLVREPNKKQL